MNEPPPQPQGSRLFRFVVVWATASAILLFGGALFFLLRARKTHAITTIPSVITNSIAEKAPEPDKFALSNSVTISLGEDESSHGLTRSQNVGDGRTVIESIDGLSARAQSLTNNRTTLNFYFQIDPSFKQGDISRVRFDVEYFAPNPGMMGIHYDALDAENVSNPMYREANQPVRLSGSRLWQKATFRTKGDAAFANRQNGQSDFRIWARTPLLYVRRVTVTREASPDSNWTKPVSNTNQVSVLLGQETPEDGLRHLVEESHTTIQNLEGLPCAYMNRVNEGRMFGSLYFAINPNFKSAGLTNARVEIEYLCKPDHSFRLQFDGMDGDTHRSYLPLLPEGARVFRFGTGADYATAPRAGVWDVATFHITNGLFMNSQRGGADFRLEVLPPEIYLRRVTLTRE